MAMQSGRERLKAWIERSKMNQSEAAVVLGVHEVVLSQWLTGARKPGLDNAHRIEEVTGIATQSWLLTDLSQDEAHASVSASKRKITKR